MPDGQMSGLGPATDRNNEPVVDPTKNVLDLVRAAIERQDDLRGELEKRIMDVIARENLHAKELRAADVAAVAAALAAAEKAVSKAEDAATRRFESVNEFRQTLTDQTSTFVPKSEVNIMVEALHEKIERAVTSQRATFITLVALALTTGVSVAIAVINTLGRIGG